MTFQDAIATQPEWIQYWVNAMGLVIVAAIVVLLCSARTRRDAVLILAAMAATSACMMVLYGQVGYVRLLGIVHVLFWTPLVIYLWYRLKDPAIASPFRQMIWLLMAVMVASLVFDYADVARYLFGDRGSLIPPTV